MAGTNSFYFKILVLICLCFLPLLAFCYLPKHWFGEFIYNWLGCYCAVFGLMFTYLLKKLVKEPFEQERRVIALGNLPTATGKALLIRIAYVISKLGFELNAFWLVLFILYKIFS